jgi:hypothetical protein
MLEKISGPKNYEVIEKFILFHNEKEQVLYVTY